MAKKRKTMGLEFGEFEDYMAKLDEIGSFEAMKKGVEVALKESKKYVTPKIEAAMVASNMPAEGEYYTGTTAGSIDTDMVVEWDGATGSIGIGFDFMKSGYVSIMLMRGTPKTKPVRGLKTAIEGAKTKREVGEIQKAALDNAIEEIMER